MSSPENGSCGIHGRLGVAPAEKTLASSSVCVAMLTSGVVCLCVFHLSGLVKSAKYGIDSTVSICSLAGTLLTEMQVEGLEVILEGQIHALHVKV